MGRAARNINGKAILYADRMTDSMKQAITETTRRRALQKRYNEAHGITPESIVKPVDMSLARIIDADYVDVPVEESDEIVPTTKEELEALVAELEDKMRKAAATFEFEKAAELRDRIRANEGSRIVRRAGAERALKAQPETRSPYCTDRSRRGVRHFGGRPLHILVLLASSRC